MNTLIVTLFVFAQVPSFPPLQVYNHNYRITSEYDKFKNTTTLDTDLATVLVDQDKEVSLKLHYFSKGEFRKADQEPVVALHLISMSHGGWWCPRKNGLT